MNLLHTITGSLGSKAAHTTNLTAGSKPRFARSAALLSVAAAMLGVLAVGAAPKAEAQTAPPYVVYSTTVLSSTFNGARANYAVNSRGDFFANDGNNHVIEYPANGGAPITLWTDTNNYGVSGVAVDLADNLYITAFYGPGGNNDMDSQVYEFPSTNGTYPSAYVYNSGSPPGSCTPASVGPPAVLANTGVCAVGLYIGAAYYYWQPLGIAADGQGNTYMYSNYDNTYSSTSHGIFQCALACNEQLQGNGATAYTVKISTTISSIIADYAGNVYFTDQNKLYYIPAGSPNSANTPVVFDGTYSTPYGVTLDVSGNMYVSDATGIWEVPAVETVGGAPCKGGKDSCKLVIASKYKLIPLSGVPPQGQASAAVDNRGNIIYSPSGGYQTTNLFESSLWAGNFAPAAIGSASSKSVNFTINFNNATTIKTITAVQGSLPATEFTVAPGTCTAGSAFAAAGTCSFSATFKPSALGIRTGAVVITDSNGNSTYTYLTGVGNGTAVTVDPGTPTQIGTGFKQPGGVAVDAAGNVYITDTTANKVQEYPAGGGAAVSLGTGLSAPTGVAVDGGGNVFIVNQGTGAAGGSVVEVPAVAGVLTNSAQKTLVTGLNLPTDIITDGDANLYVSVTGANQVIQLANPSRSNASAAMVSRGFGLLGPTGLNIDTSGNLYVADTGNNRVLELGDGFQSAVGSGLSAPVGVAVDPSGSVIIADGTGRLVRVPNETFGMNAIGLNQADQQVLSSPLSYPYSLRLDSTGNLYVSDNVAAVVDQLQRTTGSVNFGNWNVNTTSDAQSLVLSNSGNSDLTIGNPVFPAVPAATPFAVTLGSGSSACGAGTFHSGYNCTVQGTFTPTATGVSTYPLVFNTTAFNTAKPTVNLVGTGVNEAVATLKLVQTAPTTATISYGQQIIISAQVTPSGSPTPIPSGLLVFIFNGQNQRPVQLDKKTGAATITFNGLNAGNNTLCAYYEGDATYASLNAPCIPLNILLAPSTNVLTIIGDSAVPLSVSPNNSLFLTDTITPSVLGAFTGTVNFVDLTTGKPINPNPIKVGTLTTLGTYSVSYSVLGSDQTLGIPTVPYPNGTVSGNIVAQYSGNTNYLPNSSQTIGYTVILPTYTITADTTNITSAAGAPGTINLTVTDYSNFEGGVSLQCSGLPANAYCVFRPAGAELIPASGLLPNTTLSPLTIYPVPVTLQIKVDQSLVGIESGSIGWIAAFAIGMIFILRRRLGPSKLGMVSLLVVVCVSGLTLMSGCGSNSNPFPTPPGAYAVKITGTATPLLANGQEPACSYTDCTKPYDPVTNPSINVVKTVALNLTVK